MEENSDQERQDTSNAQESYGESIGMGPGRTGVKGVIRDRNESERQRRELQEQDMRDMQERMENSHLGGRTYLEEEREKGPDEKVDELILRERELMAERRHDVFGHAKEGRFGHLREVGVKGFLTAVEKEDRGVWIVVHLYDPVCVAFNQYTTLINYFQSLERCYLIDETLGRLARLHPNTKFLRARASALGFASKKPESSRQILRPNHLLSSDDEDEADGQNEDDEDEEADDNVDLDMLPTMLVYRDGELVQNWVRVDWEAGRAGLEELLDQSAFSTFSQVPDVTCCDADIIYFPLLSWSLVAGIILAFRVTTKMKTLI